MIDYEKIRMVHAAYEPQLRKATDEFGDHEGISLPRITRWIAQFDQDDLPLAEKILREITYYSSTKIRSIVRQLVESIYEKYSEYPKNRILFIPIGYSFEGSSIVARALRDIINEGFIKHMSDLVEIERESYDVLVFLDDFSGTGSQLVKWWINVESLILPKEVNFIVALLVLNSIARPKIEEFSTVICVDELDEQYNVLSEHSTKFTENEKIRIVHYCVLTGCGPHYHRGFGECGLLLVFKHGCPDNSLPILWKASVTWEPLFRRSGL